MARQSGGAPSIDGTTDAGIGLPCCRQIFQLQDHPRALVGVSLQLQKHQGHQCLADAGVVEPEHRHRLLMPPSAADAEGMDQGVQKAQGPEIRVAEALQMPRLQWQRGVRRCCLFSACAIRGWAGAEALPAIPRGVQNRHDLTQLALPSGRKPAAVAVSTERRNQGDVNGGTGGRHAVGTRMREQGEFSGKIIKCYYFRAKLKESQSIKRDIFGSPNENLAKIHLFKLKSQLITLYPARA